MKRLFHEALKSIAAVHSSDDLIHKRDGSFELVLQIQIVIGTVQPFLPIL